MRLKSVTLTGFKSFPNRTHLDFGPGVSVVVGPNGSGKSNVTDAVLWAMGEQSPLAVRGQSMQDVIFGGGRGVQARNAATVEIVFDNSDGSIDLPLGEISIERHLDRAGEGGYRLNGARCRLGDVIEVLSDTGLGREQHSVISQGRVESIVTSKPRDRRLLIEEAAGLGKHRKRRRRAQLKLERTQDNLDRALDIEREARTRLRPLKRQAEAAELHERLERQLAEARWVLACEALRARGEELRVAEARVLDARERRAGIEARLREVGGRRTTAERALTERSERHDALARRAYDARSVRDRVEMRREQADAIGQALARRLGRIEAELKTLAEPASGEPATSLQQDGGEPARVPPPEPSWDQVWDEVRGMLGAGVERALAQSDPSARARAVSEALTAAERLAKTAVQQALASGSIESQPGRGAGGGGFPTSDPAGERARRIELLEARLAADRVLAAAAARLERALGTLGEAIEASVVGIARQELDQDTAAGAQLADELRACAQQEAEIQTELRGAGEAVTEAEVAAQRLRDQAAEAELEVQTIARRLERAMPEHPGQLEPLAEEEAQALEARVQRLTRRREQLGPVNPLAQEEYAQALAHVEELETRRFDLETALRELKALIRDTDRQIAETFEQTFAAAAKNFEELVADLFPGGTGRLRLVRDERIPRPVLGGQASAEDAPAAQGGVGDGAQADGGGGVEGSEAAADAEAEREERAAAGETEGAEDGMGVEIEITPAGKSTKRLSLLSGGEKSMTALAFLFAVFLARPCPFYILDEVEAALDDLNLDRFLALLRRHSHRAQFIVITHQKRTMEAADWLYGVSMGNDGVSKVVSRRLPPGTVGSEEGDAPRANGAPHAKGALHAAPGGEAPEPPAPVAEVA
jgi:chromosome segregation ATPase